MAVDYVCEHCGFSGRDAELDDADLVLGSQCGEQVVLMEPGSGIVTEFN